MSVTEDQSGEGIAANEVDMAKWNSPVTRGELFIALQSVRNMAYNASAMASFYAQGNSSEASKVFTRMQENDQELTKFLDSLIRKSAV